MCSLDKNTAELRRRLRPTCRAEMSLWARVVVPRVRGRDQSTDVQTVLTCGTDPE